MGHVENEYHTNSNRRNDNRNWKNRYKSEYSRTCRNFHQPGKTCYLGSRCRYQHKKDEMCKYDSTGICKKGSDCIYIHKADDNQKNQNESPKKTSKLINHE